MSFDVLGHSKILLIAIFIDSFCRNPRASANLELTLFSPLLQQEQQEQEGPSPKSTKRKQTTGLEFSTWTELDGRRILMEEDL